MFQNLENRVNQDLLAHHFQRHRVLKGVAPAETAMTDPTTDFALVSNKNASIIVSVISANRPFFYPLLPFWFNCKITGFFSTLIAVKNWCLVSGSSSESKLLILEINRR